MSIGKKLSTRSCVAMTALVAGALAAFIVPAAAQAAPPPGKVKVMSRNIYLGADLTPAIEAGSPIELAIAGQEIWNDVHSTLPKKRAKLAGQRDRPGEARPRRPSGGRALAR